MMAGPDNSWQEDEGTYRAFLLRCWQEGDLENGGEPDKSFVWRFALVQLNGSSKTECFARLEELVLHLRNQLSHAEKNVIDSLDDSLSRPPQKKSGRTY